MTQNNNVTFLAMNTSSVRNNFSEVVDTVLGKERVMFKRYGKNKAALVTTDDADIIRYLLNENDYDRVLKLAQETHEEKLIGESILSQNTG